MSKKRRWTGRGIFLVAVLALFAVGAVLSFFTAWRQERLDALDAGSTVVQTEAGPVEYSDSGDGPVVLVLHGAPGGYDQAQLFGDFLVGHGFRVIAPSRPGFLRTPLETGISFEEQADAMAALLDRLGISDVGVLGISTGAQTAIEFALRHPGRTQGLALVSPVTRAYRVMDSTPGQEQLLSEAALVAARGDIGAWLYARASESSPEKALESLLALESKLPEPERAKLARYVAEDPGQLAFFRDLALTISPMSGREAGTRNDLVMLAGMSPVPDYSKIAAPVLVVAGNEDLGTPWVQPEDIVGKAPVARLYEVDGAGHLVWFGPGAAGALEALAHFLGAVEPPLPSD